MIREAVSEQYNIHKTTMSRSVWSACPNCTRGCYSCVTLHRHSAAQSAPDAPYLPTVAKPTLLVIINEQTSLQDLQRPVELHDVWNVVVYGAYAT